MRILSLTVDDLSRENIREKVLRTWIKEDPGVGKYRYDVETCQDGSKIYLLRPGALNKGCDFAIVSEGFLKYKNKNAKPPKHSDVFELIKNAIGSDLQIGRDFLEVAREVYEGTSPNIALSKYESMKNDPDCKFERAVKLLKWMWIEQDVTYWVGQGRQMLWKGLEVFINKINLKNK